MYFFIVQCSFPSLIRSLEIQSFYLMDFEEVFLVLSSVFFNMSFKTAHTIANAITPV